ncbi:MAG: branched-chain amino acid ABC transporter permease [SAR324 cluster bacterium]|nr:branched-chain amino acid ABC transporter permease [SAR324 cluster bacterium]
MSNNRRAVLSFSVMGLMLVIVGFGQSWNVALAILNLCLISAVMSMGLNMQWGYAGLFNAGVMASTAIGGLTAMLISYAPVSRAWSVGGTNVFATLLSLLLTVAAAMLVWKKMAKGKKRSWSMSAVIMTGYLFMRFFYEQATSAIEAVDPAKTGFLGGLGLPIIVSWLAGGLAAAALAWLIGRIALGLRSDYFAIATLGISEIMISILKNEDWLSRGVKNVTGLSRPVPYEVDLQQSEWFSKLVQWIYGSAEDGSALSADMMREAMQLSAGVFVKLCYTVLFLAVVLIILGFATRALNSPWGRMMRAIRDNETAAAAMGKDVTSRHRQVFIIGSAVIGISGAMLTTLDGQFTPGSYIPLRFTFLIWVMVIIGGSGNNLGAIIGAFITWFVWIEAEPSALWLVSQINVFLEESNPLRQHLQEVAPHMRMVLMGLILVLVLRFKPKGILPEEAPDHY